MLQALFKGLAACALFVGLTAAAQGINLNGQVTGVLKPVNGGTGLNTAGVSGCPKLTNGTWTVNSANCLTGSAVTWPASGSLLISNGTNAPAGLAEADDECAIGASGVWTTGACGTSSPLTTKGDLYGFSTTNARIPVGSNGQVLTADSSQSLGLKWNTLTFTSINGGTNNSAAMVVGPSASLNWSGSYAGLTGPTIANMDTGAFSGANIFLTNSADSAQFFKAGTGYTTYQNLHADDFALLNGAGNISFFEASGNINMRITAGSTPQFTFSSTALTATVPVSATSGYFSSNVISPVLCADTPTTVDTCLTRASAGTMDLGNGTAGDVSGTLQLGVLNLGPTSSYSTATVMQITNPASGALVPFIVSASGSPNVITLKSPASIALQSAAGIAGGIGDGNFPNDVSWDGSGHARIPNLSSGGSGNSDLNGRLTLVSGTASQAFNRYGNKPVCTASDETAQNAVQPTYSGGGGTAWTVTFHGTGTDAIAYICTGQD
jgi:hypothetical protein